MTTRALAGMIVAVIATNGAAAEQTGSDETFQFAATVLADTEDSWKGIFLAAGKVYVEPTLVVFTGRTDSACGSVETAGGPFYCADDRKVYLDLVFLDELGARYNAPGDFAEAYVIALGVGYHVQNILGILPRVEGLRRVASKPEADRLSAQLALQADCFAGIWAHDVAKRGLLDVGDIAEAVNAAAQFGDEAFRSRGQSDVAAANTFSHGTSEQRTRWFNRGYDRGDLADCDAFGPNGI